MSKRWKKMTRRRRCRWERKIRIRVKEKNGIGIKRGRAEE